jgi:hypothetical protein
MKRVHGSYCTADVNLANASEGSLDPSGLLAGDPYNLTHGLICAYTINIMLCVVSLGTA